MSSADISSISKETQWNHGTVFGRECHSETASGFAGNNVQGQGSSLPEDSYVFSSYGVHDIRNSKWNIFTFDKSEPAILWLCNDWILWAAVANLAVAYFLMISLQGPQGGHFGFHANSYSNNRYSLLK
jgi:hypothetical protein